MPGTWTELSVCYDDDDYDDDDDNDDNDPNDDDDQGFSFSNHGRPPFTEK